MKQYELEQRINSYLKDQERSQAWVAKKLGYAPDTFNKWVHSVNRMPDTVIVAFCNLFKLDEDQCAELLALAGYVAPSANSKATAVEPHLMPGLVFATKIMANGQAVNPGTVFPANISDLYAVFLPDKTPPGTDVNVGNPITDAYYAYLKVRNDANLHSFGWKWYYEGETVNEYETQTTPGDIVWLQRFGYEEGGIFNGDPFKPGIYRIAVLLGGNPAISSKLTVTSDPKD